jgi:hypothetical protein
MPRSAPGCRVVPGAPPTELRKLPWSVGNHQFTFGSIHHDFGCGASESEAWLHNPSVGLRSTNQRIRRPSHARGSGALCVILVIEVSTGIFFLPEGKGFPARADLSVASAIPPVDSPATIATKTGC